MHSLLDLDRLIFASINGGWSGPAGDVLFPMLSVLGSGAGATILGFFGMLFFDRKRFPKNFIVFALVLLLTGLTVQIVKQGFYKSRPLGDPAYSIQKDDYSSAQVVLPGVVRYDYTLKSTNPYAGPARGKIHAIGYRWTRRGFPSGHTANAFGFAMCLILAFKNRWRYLWLLVAAGIGLARIYVGAHFPLDVVAGAAIGMVVPYVLLKRGDKYFGLGVNRPKPFTTKGANEDPIIMMVAGEASADVYGANLINEILLAKPETKIFGVGGHNMKKAGLDVIHDSAALSIVGFTGVVSAAHRIRRIYKDLLAEMKVRRPDVLVTIDLPDFNLMLATQAKALGVKVVYYISPQVWAWRTGRIRTIADRVDLMVVAFPFEMRMYQDVGLRTEFYGHPLLEVLRPEMSTARAAAHFGLDSDKRTIVIAPGSRKNEIKYLSAQLFEAGRILADGLPDWQFAVPVAPNVDQSELAAIANAAGFSPVFTKDHFHDLLNIASFGIITSGTATLEAALLSCPMLIVYRGHPLNVAIAKKMIRIDKIGLPNIIADGFLFPEVIQDQATGPALAKMTLEVIEDTQAYQKMMASCEKVRNALSGGETSSRVAGAILDLLEGKRS